MATRRAVLSSLLTVTAAGLLGGPSAGISMAADRGWPIPLRRRVDWAADEALRYDSAGAERWPRDFHDVQVITVHHSATRVAPDPAETVRAIYRTHTINQGWGDIGYHLLIAPDGQVYEGRFTGSGTPVFAAGAGPARCVTAGHVRGCNDGNIGVCLLGDFTTVPAPAPAMHSLVGTLTALCERCGIDPLATVRYHGPVSGITRDVHTVSMHRDWRATACPGNTIAAVVDAVRTQVAGARRPSTRT